MKRGFFTEVVVNIAERIAVLDIETWKSKSFAFGVFYWTDTQEYQTFYSASALKTYILNMVRKDKKTKYKFKILGHNISYDLNWIFGNYEIFFTKLYKKEGKRERVMIDCLARGGRFYYAKYYNIKIIDTFNLWPMSLADAGEAVGFNKLQTPDKFLDGKISKITEKDVEYCRRDCEVCFKIYVQMKEFVESLNGKLGLTISSSSVSILRNWPESRINEFLNILNSNWRIAELDDKFRKGYYGGRTEVFEREIKFGNYYDVNSLYPSVMQPGNFYPDPTKLRTIGCDLNQNILDRYEGCADILIEIPENLKYPPLPVRNEILQKNIFPVGKIRGVYCFPEIRLALSLGCEILETHEIIISDRIDSPFGKLINDFYELRKEYKKTKDPREKILKRFMNHLYGKFCQWDYEDKIFKLDTYEGEGEIFKHKGEWYVRVSTEKTRSRMDIICIGAYVTSLSRCKLYDYIMECEKVVYCDTDSIITTSILEDSKELGEMKLEHKILYGSFLGRKDYFIIEAEKGVFDKINGMYIYYEGKGFVKRKGCPLKSLLEYDEISVTKKIKNKLKAGHPEICRKIHNSDLLKFEKITKSRESIRRNFEAGILIETEKQRLNKFDSGRVWLDDKISKPINIDMSIEEAVI